MSASSQYTSAAGRRRQMTRMYSAEDQALNQISTEAEARLAAKRAARAEAREIRRYEIERQQREREASEVLDKDIRAERVLDLSAEPSRTRNSSGDSTDGGKDVKAQMRELNEKYKKSMMTNAQLDNEKQALIYQVSLLQDKLDDQEEEMIETNRQYKDKCKELDLSKRSLKDLDYEFNNVKKALDQRDRLLQESGLVIVATDDGDVKLEKGSAAQNGPASSNAALLSTETIESLGKIGDGSLGTDVKSDISSSKSVVHGNRVDSVCGEGSVDTFDGKRNTNICDTNKAPDFVDTHFAIKSTDISKPEISASDKFEKSSELLDTNSPIKSDPVDDTSVDSERCDEKQDSEAEDEFFDAPSTPLDRSPHTLSSVERASRGFDFVDDHFSLEKTVVNDDKGQVGMSAERECVELRENVSSEKPFAEPDILTDMESPNSANISVEHPCQVRCEDNTDESIEKDMSVSYKEDADLLVSEEKKNSQQETETSNTTTEVEKSDMVEPVGCTQDILKTDQSDTNKNTEESKTPQTDTNINCSESENPLNVVVPLTGESEKIKSESPFISEEQSKSISNKDESNTDIPVKGTEVTQTGDPVKTVLYSEQSDQVESDLEKCDIARSVVEDVLIKSVQKHLCIDSQSSDGNVELDKETIDVQSSGSVRDEIPEVDQGTIGVQSNGSVRDEMPEDTYKSSHDNELIDSDDPYIKSSDISTDKNTLSKDITELVEQCDMQLVNTQGDENIKSDTESIPTDISHTVERKIISDMNSDDTVVTIPLEGVGEENDKHSLQQPDQDAEQINKKENEGITSEVTSSGVPEKADTGSLADNSDSDDKLVIEDNEKVSDKMDDEGYTFDDIDMVLNEEEITIEHSKIDETESNKEDQDSAVSDLMKSPDKDSINGDEANKAMSTSSSFTCSLNESTGDELSATGRSIESLDSLPSDTLSTGKQESGNGDEEGESHKLGKQGSKKNKGLFGRMKSKFKAK